METRDGDTQEDFVLLLKILVGRFKANPALIHDPKYQDLKDYIASLGGILPPSPLEASAVESEDATKTSKSKKKKKKKTNATTEDAAASAQPATATLPATVPQPASASTATKPSPTAAKSSNAGPPAVTVLGQGHLSDMMALADPPDYFMGEAHKKVTDKDRQVANELKSQGQELVKQKKHEEAVKCFTNAITLDPSNFLLFCLRGESLLSQQQIRFAIRDANKALILKNESARALRLRGRAYGILGQYDLAAKDLKKAQEIHFDPTAEADLKKYHEKYYDQGKDRFEGAFIPPENLFDDHMEYSAVPFETLGLTPDLMERYPIPRILKGVFDRFKQPTVGIEVKLIP